MLKLSSTVIPTSSESHINDIKLDNYGQRLEHSVPLSCSAHLIVLYCPEQPNMTYYVGK